MSRVMIAVSLAVIMVVSAGVAGDKPWFDMENCAMCKVMVEKPDLMKNITWESHKLSNGILSVTTVNKGHLDSYRAAHKHMDDTAMRLQKGETLELCGSCMAFGAIMMKGVTQEYVETSTGDVWIVQSDDPEVVTELQNWVKRNDEEMASMKKPKG